MACSCCDFSDVAGKQFAAKKAANQLRDYRRGQVGPTTRLLRDGLVAARLNSGALLDIGAGIGALTFELLNRGVASAVAVEASSAYLAAAAAEATRQNRSTAIEFLHGDFVTLANELPMADVVTLDRVVCCYPDYRSLLDHAARRARRGLALSYPRDRWFVRFGVRIENAARGFRSNTFQTFVHPVDDIRRVIHEGGFELVARHDTAAWSADIYARRSVAGDAG
jgi:magnesium-protoporphyrin O-methyltransferase